jgi:hypothetical protein
VLVNVEYTFGKTVLNKENQQPLIIDIRTKLPDPTTIFFVGLSDIEDLTISHPIKNSHGLEIAKFMA